jgi:hypothetical protein
LEVVEIKAKFEFLNWKAQLYRTDVDGEPLKPPWRSFPADHDSSHAEWTKEGHLHCWKLFFQSSLEEERHWKSHKEKDYGDKQNDV